MQQQRLARWCILCLTAVVAFPASAWGPKTQASVVLASGHIFAQRSKIASGPFTQNLKQGVRISPEEEALLYPHYADRPIQSIQQEIYLLQAVRSSHIDPYFSYRMGVLGKKVVELVSPMRTADPQLRKAYDSDIERVITQATLTGKDAVLVAPRDYFRTATQDAASNDKLISYDYQTNLGIKGIAGKSLHQDASRAVAAVADVWHTIFNSAVSGSNISKSDMRDYMLGSIDFYLKRNEIKEVNRVYALAKSKGVLTPEMRKKIGDLYYDNQHYEEALHIYHGLLAEKPGQRDVSKRIAAYHILMGDRAAKKGNLEEAQDAYKMAVQADGFEEEGSRKLVSMDIVIEKRDFRNMTQRDLNALARKLIADADKAARERDYAGAIQYLQEANIAYANVTDEFPALSKQKTMGMHTLKMKSKEMKEALVKNAQRLSGSGFAFDAKRLAGMTENTTSTALQTVVKAEYESAVSDIATDIATP